MYNLLYNRISNAYKSLKQKVSATDVLGSGSKNLVISDQLDIAWVGVDSLEQELSASNQKVEECYEERELYKC